MTGTCKNCGVAADGWCHVCQQPLRPLNPSETAEFLLSLHDSLALRTAENQGVPPLPEVVWVSAETGRGKTYAVQRFFDLLSRRSSGYWGPGLAPTWPPPDVNALHRQRKIVTPPRELGHHGQRPTFFWIGISCGELVHARGSDLASVVVGQVLAQAAALIQAEADGQRRLAGERVLDGLGKDVVEMLLPRWPSSFLTIGRRLVQYIRERSPDTYLEGTSTQLVAVIRRLQRVTAVPGFVVVLDDAHLIDVDTLSLLSSLVTGTSVGENGEPAGIETLDEGVEADPDVVGGRRWLTFTRTPLAPVMFVATAWPHRLRAAFADTPFHQWWSEAYSNQMTTEIELVAGIDPREAESLARPAGLPDPQVERLLRRLRGEKDEIVPLVLAEDMALLEQQRDRLTDNILVDDAFIDALPADPYHHIRDRLAALDRHEPGGSNARGLLDRLALWGPRPPLYLALAVFQVNGAPWPEVAARDSISLLEEHGLLVSPDSPEGEGDGCPSVRLRQTVIDGDVAQYLANEVKGIVQKADVSRAAALVLRSAFDTLARELRCHAVLPWRQIVDALRPGARWVGASQDTDLAMLAAALTRTPPSERPSDLRGLGLLLWNVVANPGHPDEDELLQVVEEAAPNRWTLRAARQLVHPRAPDERVARVIVSLRRIDRESPTPNVFLGLLLSECLERLGQLDQAIDATAIVAKSDPTAALRLASLLEKRGEGTWIQETVRLLQPLSSQYEAPAIHLADLYERLNSLDDAVSVLKPLASQSGNVAVRLSAIYEKLERLHDAAAVLDPLAGQFGNVAVSLASIYERMDQPDKAVAVLKPLAGFFEHVALSLSSLYERLYRPGDAVTALLPLADQFGNVAVRLSSLYERLGRYPDAVTVLEPLAGRDEHAAIRLAHIHEAFDRLDDAVIVLKPLAHQSGNAAVRLSELYERLGRLEDAVAILSPLAEEYANVALRLSEVYRRLERSEDALIVVELLATKAEQAALWASAAYVDRHQLEEALRVLDMYPDSRNPHLLGQRVGIELVLGRSHLTPVPEYYQSNSQRFVAGVARVFRPFPLDQPSYWARFFAHRWPKQVPEAATEYLARSSVTIVRGAFPDLPTDNALREFVKAIWPNKRSALEAVGHLVGRLRSWSIDAPVPARLQAIKSAANALTVCETLRALRASYYEDHRLSISVQHIIEAVTEKLVRQAKGPSESAQAIRATIRSCIDWSPVALRVLQVTDGP